MNETENTTPITTEVKPGKEMTLRHGKIALVGRSPEKADYIRPDLRQQCDLVSLKIDDPNISDYLSRAAILMLSKDNLTTIAVPQEASAGITTFDLKNEPKNISPGEKISYTNGGLNWLDVNVNGHTVRLRLTGKSNNDQNFLLEIDPK